jgi:hypothetical protein
VIDNSDARRRAGITADQFSNNGLRFFCGLYDSGRLSNVAARWATLLTLGMTHGRRAE